MLFPDGGIIDTQFYSFDQLTKINTPSFQNGTIFCRRSSTWGNRVANGPPNLELPGLAELQPDTGHRGQPDEGHERHTLKAGFYFNTATRRRTAAAAVPGR